MATIDGSVFGTIADADGVVCLPVLVGEFAKAKLLLATNTAMPIANHALDFRLFVNMMISILLLASGWDVWRQCQKAISWS